MSGFLLLFEPLSGAGGGPDPDAVAYLDAAGISDPTQRAAWNASVVSLKGEDIWDDLISIFPLIGGTQATHSWDAKRLVQGVFTTGATHNALGAGGAGLASTSGTFDTGVVPSAIWSSNTNASIGVYMRTDVDEYYAAIGVEQTADQRCGMVPRNNPSFAFTDMFDAAFGRFGGSTTYPTTKLWISTRGDPDPAGITYRDGVALYTGAPSSIGGTLPTLSMGGLGFRQGGTLYSTQRTHSFVFFGFGLSPAKVTALNTIVNTLQSALGRAI